MSETGKHTLSDLQIAPDLKTKKGFSPLKIALVLIIIISIGIFLKIKYSAPKAVLIKTFSIKTSQKQAATSILSASGYVTPRRRATVASKITGRVVNMLVEEGMKVKKGQILAKLDDSDTKKQYLLAISKLNEAKAALKQTEIQLINAKKEYLRITHLKESNMASKQEFDNSETAFHSLQAQVSLAKTQIKSAISSVNLYKQQLENYIVKAPFSGIAVSKDAEVGEMVSPVSAGGGFTRTGISTIVDMNSLEIEVDVNESYIARVLPKQSVIAVLDAYPKYEYKAQVRTIIPTADRQKATVKVRISFDKLDSKILPDMGVKVSFLSEEEKKDNKSSILIPKNAVIKEKGTTFVFVINNEKAEKRAISTDKVFENKLSVIAGLSSGEIIAITNIENLKDNSTIKIQ